jgi:molybdenum cofactor cytidylyltransferase
VKPIVGILLAAGSGSRFGSNKLMAKLADGRSVLDAAAQSFVQVLPAALAVVRSTDDAVARVLGELGYTIVVNPKAEAGMGSSLAIGVQASMDAGGWVVGLADMPWIEPATIAAVRAGLRDGASICAPVWRGRRGHPVGFASRWRDALAGLAGDQGARGLLAAHPGVLLPVETGDPGVVRDVDLPADLAALDTSVLLGK